MVQGGGRGWWNPLPPWVFDMLPFVFSTKWGVFCGWWRCWRSVTSPNMVAIMDFSRITTQVKKEKITKFLRLTCKITLHYFIHKLYFYSQRKLKTCMHFHSKLAWPPASYDVISRTHSNWPSLNLSQNAREGQTNSYRKLQVLMFYCSGKKKSEKLKGLPCTSKG